jgi:uncharacterized protein YkwD
MAYRRGLLVLVGLGAVLSLVRADPPAPEGKDKFQLSKVEQRLLELTNAERKKQDLPPLRPDPRLFKAARAHSANMARQEKMDHILDGKTPFDRIKNAGYGYGFAGENVGFADADVEDVMKAWMASPAHRDNILKRQFTDIGLGAAGTDKGIVYYTQVFASPRKPRAP